MTIDTAKVEILMAEQGLNQKELGERCGMPRQNISSIIRRGKAEPRTVGKLAGGLGVTVAELVPKKEPQMMEALGTDAVDKTISVSERELLIREYERKLARLKSGTSPGDVIFKV